jgi:hypothetical protein
MTVATASLTLVAASSASAATVFGFQNQYAPSNWRAINFNSDGFEDTRGAPASISLTAGNNGSTTPGTTDYTITAAAPGTVKFDWNFSNNGDGANIFGYLLKGTYHFLADSSGQSGTSTFNVSAGDSFGFFAYTFNSDGIGTGTISNFEAPAPTPTPVSVPESSSVLGLLALGGLGIGLKCRKRK